ncbi:MAG TPA: glycosyltransferase family 39 protein [Anaerolineae bacterium]|nr:glycosyltransferase family 39 protein [Anaerolineae bacterium]
MKRDDVIPVYLSTHLPVTQRHRREWPSVVGLLLIAAAFRLLALNDVPPGLHHDEVIIGQIAKDILRGQLAIYFTPGYGHEPLYHYTVAGMFAALGANAFVLRLTSAFIAILGLAVTYRFTRRLFSPAVAVGALAWMAVTLWPIFFARVGLRGITLPLLTTLTAYFLWRALDLETGDWRLERGPNFQLPTSNLQLHPSSFLLPGALLGLTLYTYQASRVFPIIFAVFFVYLFITRRSRFTSHASRLTLHALRSLLLFFAVAALVAAPLAIYLIVINPGAEARVADLSGPLNKLLAGDPAEVVQSTLNTLGMFTIAGDHVPIYNLAGRPAFPEPLGAALFYLGLLISLRRWRQPAYALVLIWFAISLVPAMVTPFSPNFVRTIASWPMPFVFCGIALAYLHSLITHHLSPRAPAWLTAGFAVLIAFNAFLTARDYFLDWPRGDYVRFWQQATWTQAARTLDADPSTLPVAASGLSIHALDPQTFELLLKRTDLSLKWFDCRNAILYPGGAAARYLSPDFFPCDPNLWARYLPEAELIAQPRWPDSGNVILTLHQFDARPWLDSLLPSLSSQPIYAGGESFTAGDPSTNLEPLALPLDLDGLRLLGWTMDRDSWRPGETVEIESGWKVTAPLAEPLSLFVHVSASDGAIIAQFDGLDVGVASLEPGDVFVQRHRLPLPPDATPGPYRLSLGAYHPDTGARLTAVVDGRAIDTLVLGRLNLLK